MNYILSNPDRVLDLLRQHLIITGLALAIALAIAVPLGILVARHPRLDTPILGTLGLVYTIPSLALLALLIPTFGLGLRNLLVALVLYVQFILVRNIVVGLRGVDPAIIEAARGMGLSAGQILWQVELPLAFPIILAGIRLATVTIVAIATIGAWVAAGGLGVLFNEGLNTDNPVKIVAGSLVIIPLAIVLNQVFLGLERYAGRWRAR